MTRPRLSPRGLAAACGTFVIWGLLPVYLHPLSGVPAIQVIAHRVAWSCLLILGWMLANGELRQLSAVLSNPRLLARLTLTALLISANWLVYVWSATHGHIVDASLGYYINPLMNVLLGVVLLHERMNRLQWTAIAIAALAVAYLTVLAAGSLWISLTLAVSFSMYGLIRKVISVDALPGLATETLLLLPLAVGYLLWCQAAGTGAFTADGPAVAALLVGSGLVTALPLFLYAYGARRLPFSTLGVLQYLAPSLQLLCGVVFYHEGFASARAAGFGMLWLALLIYAGDSWWRTRAAARDAARA